MYRKLLLAAVVVLLGALSVRVLVAPRQGPKVPGREIVFIQEGSPAPLSAPNRPLGKLQDALDAVSQAAVQANWPQAARALQEMQGIWESLRPRDTGSLQWEEKIERLLKELQQSVWARDSQGVLQSAQELTGLLGRLGT